MIRRALLREPSALRRNVIAQSSSEILAPSSTRRAGASLDEAAKSASQLDWRASWRGGRRFDDQATTVPIGAQCDIIIGECKWGAAGRNDLATLAARRDLSLRELRGVTRVHLALFSVSPVVDAALNEQIAAGDALHILLDDLYQ
ncbi:MAG: hypothetical protein H7099_03420 [Gemmatimonadaceae bacterium]|nr:hypothetical protein [Gemmatimonadaceae bacterium]